MTRWDRKQQEAALGRVRGKMRKAKPKRPNRAVTQEDVIIPEQVLKRFQREAPPPRVHMHVVGGGELPSGVYMMQIESVKQSRDGLAVIVAVERGDDPREIVTPKLGRVLTGRLPSKPAMYCAPDGSQRIPHEPKIEGEWGVIADFGQLEMRAGMKLCEKCGRSHWSHPEGAWGDDCPLPPLEKP